MKTNENRKYQIFRKVGRLCGAGGKIKNEKELQRKQMKIESIKYFAKSGDFAERGVGFKLAGNVLQLHEVQGFVTAYFLIK
jgi:hypothetical protein